MSKADQFDLFQSRAERDAGIAQVTGHAEDFMGEGLAFIARMTAGRLVIGEDIRRDLVMAGITPHHSNAYGALVGTAVKRGLLVKTGRHGQMRAVRSHARSTPIYEVGAGWNRPLKVPNPANGPQS